MWSTTSDPSDGYSNHFSNAPEPDEVCPACGCTDIKIEPDNEGIYIDIYYRCNGCANLFILK